MMIVKNSLTGAIAAAVLALATNAALAEGVKVGVLECKVSSGFGFVVGSSRDVSCVYLPSKDGNKQYYDGKIKKFGVDIGYVSEATIMWAVVAPNWDVPQGALAGDYVGGTASAAAGYGAGANALVGGGGKSFALQPVSVEGQKGIAISAGIGDLTLRSKQ
ncbi:MAG: DUF992 domain-containing protein [Alphaproteobacteria bacterium]|nr:DUF992 domain-containing protein [Alphaproteobacteria bacterium]